LCYKARKTLAYYNPQKKEGDQSHLPFLNIKGYLPSPSDFALAAFIFSLSAFNASLSPNVDFSTC